MGGVPSKMKKSFEFISVTEACRHIDLGFSGHRFTWFNHRGIAQRIWKILHRAIVNDICL